MCKIFENRSRFDKVTESFKVVTFLRHSVHKVLYSFGSVLYVYQTVNKGGIRSGDFVQQF